MKTFSAATLCAAAFAAENTAPVISLSLDAYQPTHDGHGTDSENHNLCGNSTTGCSQGGCPLAVRQETRKRRSICVSCYRAC